MSGSDSNMTSPPPQSPSPPPSPPSQSPPPPPPPPHQPLVLLPGAPAQSSAPTSAGPVTAGLSTIADPPQIAGSKRPERDWEDEPHIPSKFLRSEPASRDRRISRLPRSIGARDRNEDVKIGRGQGTWEVLFADNSSFTGAFRLTNQDWDQDHKVTFLIRAEPKGRIQVRESLQRQDPYYKDKKISRDGRVEILHGTYDLVRFDYEEEQILVDNDAIPSNWWEVVVNFRDELKVLNDPIPGDQNAFVYETKQKLHVPELQLNDAAIQGKRWLKFRLQDPNSVVPFWDEKTARELLEDANLVKRGEREWNVFLDLQQRALELERDTDEAATKSLGRTDARALIQPAMKAPGRIQVTLSSPRDEVEGVSWVLPANTLVTLESGECFRPSESLGPKDGTRWEGGWIATIMDWGMNVALIHNEIPPDFANRWVGQEVSVSVTPDTDDPTYSKLRDIIKRVRNCFKLEDETISEEEKTELESKCEKLRVPLLPIALDSHTDFSSSQPITLRNGGDNFTLSDSLQLRESHVEALKHICQSPLGFAAVQGPPAAGKTELVMKIVGLLLGQKASDGKIVVATKTNVAIWTVAQRLVEKLLPMFGINAVDKVCLFQTETVASKLRLSSKAEHEFAKRVSIDQHILRRAQTTNDRAYLEFWNQVVQNGEILEGNREAYNRLRDKYKSQVRRECPVILSTLAATTQRFFMNNNGKRYFKTDVLIVDEASQAEFTAVLGAWYCCDPGHIILTGDYIQLEPHTKTQLAKRAWCPSLLERLYNRGFPLVMMKEQFRTHESLYCATSEAWYHGEVQSHQSTANRAFYNLVKTGLPRVHFIDKNGGKFRPRDNCHFFHITNARSEVVGETKSSRNQFEADFIDGFVKALRKIGCSDEDILLLTAYKAQAAKLSEIKGQSKLNVGVVDGYQGGECNMLILSLVRDDQSGASLGFLGKRNRQNVFTSRAKDAQFLVGCLPLFQKNPAWQKYLKVLKEKHGNDWAMEFEGPVQWYVDGTLV
ncbi:MAG: hypothetical protein Q9227_008934 [Pyrenula ochraceoflavens]